MPKPTAIRVRLDARLTGRTFERQFRRSVPATADIERVRGEVAAAAHAAARRFADAHGLWLDGFAIAYAPLDGPQGAVAVEIRGDLTPAAVALLSRQASATVYDGWRTRFEELARAW